MSTPAEQQELKNIVGDGSVIVPVQTPPPMPAEIRDAIIMLSRTRLKIDLTSKFEAWEAEWERWRKGISVGQ